MLSYPSCDDVHTLKPLTDVHRRHYILGLTEPRSCREEVRIS